MTVVRGLVWDDWNKEHIYRHGVSIKEVEEVCHGKYTAKESYRKRVQIVGKTRSGRTLIIVFSPEDRNLKAYEQGIYYPITAFEEEEL